MNEHAARDVLLLKALETDADAPRAGAAWAADDAAWASRAALESVGAQAAADRFIADRARHAMQRLAEREPTVRPLTGRRAWRAPWPAWAAALGLIAGLLADAIGSGQRINLLAPPMWGVVAWNLVVYALVMGNALRAVFTRSARTSGWLARVVQRGLLQPFGSGSRRAAATGLGASVVPTFEMSWARHAAPLTASRAGLLLHTAAAALGLGLVVGLYLRGLVLDYRAGWESTFLDAPQVHAVLAWVLAPASALTGLAMPDATALQAMRVVPGNAAAGAPAAVWIHLFAVTLMLLVVLPRLVLALGSGLRAGALARRFPLALDDGYFQRLLRHQHGGTARVQVLPYAQAPGPLGEKGVRAVIGRLFGGAADVHVAPVIAYGTEDELAGQTLVPPGTTLAIALFDLTATPEAENHGRLVGLLAGLSPAHPSDASGAQSPAPACDGAPPQAPAVVMLVDESAFVRRFGVSSDRRVQRREAWRQLAETLHTGVVFADLSAPDLPATERDLQAAMTLVRPGRQVDSNVGN